MYDQDVGLYVLDDTYGNVKNTLVFNKCDVLVDQSLNQIVVDTSLHKSIYLIVVKLQSTQNKKK